MSTYYPNASSMLSAVSKIRELLENDQEVKAGNHKPGTNTPETRKGSKRMKKARAEK